MNRRTSRRTSGERQEVEEEIGKKICKFNTNLSYIKKQNKTTITNLKKKLNVLLPLSHVEHIVNATIIFYWKALPQNFRQRALYKVDRAPLNTDSKIPFRRMTAVLTLKTQRKLILSHLKNRFRTKPIQYKFVCHENVFCYLYFRSYLKGYYQKSLPFALKSIFTFEIHCKNHLITTPKTTAKNRHRQRPLTLFGVAWKHKMLRDVTHQMTSGRTPS